MILELALAATAAGPARPIFVDRASAQAGETVTFHSRTRAALRVYLAPIGANVRSRLDGRLRYLGTLRRSRGAFVIPAVNAGRYRIWCSVCARPRPALRVTWPAGCPVSASTHHPMANTVANDALSTWVDTARATPGGDGTYTWKMYWIAESPRTFGALFISASRIDAPGFASIGTIHRGSNTPTPSWASVLTFHSAGCWRVTARVDDLTLVRVVAIP